MDKKKLHSKDGIHFFKRKIMPLAKKIFNRFRCISGNGISFSTTYNRQAGKRFLIFNTLSQNIVFQRFEKEINRQSAHFQQGIEFSTKKRRRGKKVKKKF